MHFVETLRSKSKQQNSKNFNEIAVTTAFTKNFTFNKKQDTSLKLLLKVSNRVSEET